MTDLITSLLGPFAPAMASDKSKPTEYSTGFIPPSPPRLSAVVNQGDLLSHLQPGLSVEPLEEIEHALSLIDFDLFQRQTSIYKGDIAQRTITRYSCLIGNGLSFVV